MTEEVQQDVAQVDAQTNFVAEGQTPTDTGTGGQPQATWKYAENIMGEGEPPDWFIANKYKSVEEQAKAANELRKKLGAMADGAPDAYQLEYEALGIKQDDPHLQELTETFKELNIPQDAFTKIIGKYVDVQKKSMAEFEQQRQAAWQAVGADTKSKVENWLNNNLSADEKAVASNWLVSVEDIKVLEKIRASAPKSAPPTANQTPVGNSYETVESINNEIQTNWQRMKSDPIYQRQMENKRREARLREEQG